MESNNDDNINPISLDQQIQEAKHTYVKELEELYLNPTTYSYNEELDVIKLTNPYGYVWQCPRTHIQGLQDANTEELNDVWIHEDSIHWDSLDVSMHISGLLKGELGSKSWMEELKTKLSIRK
jgi:hypothetical protein